jgi:hypothetical protein
MPLGTVNADVLKSWVLFNQSNTEALGPWGASFSSNLTSSSTGIGNWTEQQFITSLRKGITKGIEGSRPMLPPMPWQNIGKATDADLKALFAFFKASKPVDNVVPQPVSPDKLASLK